MIRKKRLWMKKNIYLIFSFVLFCLFNLFTVKAWADGAVWLNQEAQLADYRYLEVLPVQFIDNSQGNLEAWNSSLLDLGRKSGYQVEQVPDKNSVSSSAELYAESKVTKVKSEKTWADGYSIQVHMVRRFELSDTKGKRRSWELDNGYHTHTVQGCYVYTNEVEAEYYVYDRANNNLIFTYQNSLAGSSKNEELFKELTKDFYKELKKALQNKK